AASNTVGGATVGSGNVISGNAGDGIMIDGQGTTGNVVAGNYVGTSTQGGTTIPGAVALYRGDGNTQDALGTHNGVAQGGVSFTAGEIGQAIQFNGTDSAVRVTTRLADFETPNVTVEMWVNSTNPGTRAYLVSKGANGDLFGSYALDTT